MLLNRLGNAFVIEGELPDESDLFTAVWVCSRNYADGIFCLEHATEWRIAMGQWIAAYCQGTTRAPRVPGSAPASVPRPINFAAACAAFTEYLKLGSTVPSFKPIERGGISFTLELALVHGVKIHLLRNHVVQSETEFLDRPWGLSKWDYYALKGLAGDCEIFDASAVEAAQQMANALFAKLNQQSRAPKVERRKPKKHRHSSRSRPSTLASRRKGPHGK